MDVRSVVVVGVTLLAGAPSPAAAQYADAIGGRVVTTECYADVRGHPGLPEELYDPATFATWLWAEETYPKVAGPPECALRSDR